MWGAVSSWVLPDSTAAGPWAGQEGLAEIGLTLHLIFVHLGQNCSKLHGSLPLVLIFS